tara:strand:- start:272 stop:988 length:717 start_codon:yes stop_codon:yes gene_type:complete
MNLFGLPKTYLLRVFFLLLLTETLVASSETNLMHKKCLEARDYAGCMRVQSGSKATTRESSDQQCEPYKFCTATAGMDPLGRPKIQGWRMKYKPSERSVTYLRPSFRKVNVRGETNRYVEFEMLIRFIEDPRAATAPTTTTIGSSQTNCTGYGSWISCSTTPPATITLPGSAGRTGGIREVSYITVIDCKDKTAGMHSNGKLLGRWEEVKPGTYASALKDACPIINSLKTSSFKKYAK